MRNYLGKRLSPTEYESRKSKGLCFHCDEIFRKGHKCKQLFTLSIVDDREEAYCEEMEDLQPQEDSEGIEPEISLHALAGFKSPQTIRFQGTCKNKNVEVLWDCGSSNNFIQPRVVALLG